MPLTSGAGMRKGVLFTSSLGKGQPNWVCCEMVVCEGSRLGRSHAIFSSDTFSLSHLAHLHVPNFRSELEPAAQTPKNTSTPPVFQLSQPAEQPALITEKRPKNRTT